jgi:carboxyl-terminal processing protease
MKKVTAMQVVFAVAMLLVVPAVASENSIIREAVRAFYTTFVERPNAEALLAGALRGLKLAQPKARIEVLSPPGRYLVSLGQKKITLDEQAVSGQEGLVGALQGLVELALSAGGVEKAFLEQTLLRHLTQACGERWTSFIGREALSALIDDGSSSVGWVGLVPLAGPGGLFVLSVDAESPAARAGIRPGQRLEKIAGGDTQNLSEMEALGLLRGRLGGKVEVVVEGKAHLLEFAAEGARNIEVDPPREGLARVRIYNFRADTGKRLRAVLEKLEGMGMTGLVLDLRSNPGGLVEEGVEVLKLFSPAGDLVRIAEREQRRLQVMSNPAPGRYQKLPLVVLVDRRTASVAEMVAQALRDMRGARLVGEKTLGKGVVQVLVELSDGSALKLSSARFGSARGGLLFDGLEPEVEIDLENLGDQAQEKAFGLLKKTEN